MNNYNFDEVRSRKNTRSQKWDGTKRVFFKRTSNLLPLYVADMDFPSPRPIIDAIIKRAKHEFFGYTILPTEYYEATINWFKRRHEWEIDESWILYTPGVIPALNIAVQTYCKPGDKILLSTPFYPPFSDAIRNNKCRRILNPLKLSTEKGKYERDFEDFRTQAKDPDVKLFILCSPHNPTGRVWIREELTQLGEICIENNILILSDEIHCDLIYPGHKHVPFASISEKFAQNSIICTSPSKTFNIPSMEVANIIIPNSKLKNKFIHTQQRNAITKPNCFASHSLEAAYNESEEWLNELLVYLKENLEFLKEFIKKNMPKVEVIEPEGTFLVWLDFRKYGLDSRELSKILLEGAEVALFEGWLFGKAGKGFERINIGCPRSILEEALNRIAKAFNTI